ncbi:alpha/beta hydrolase [Thermoactinospora rubra]|uniref:alpha/beta hydrolase n=1 Tax=Thermoactinospora rubra TaxID=1088767 RepID=UPI001301E767|nr:alpha/beta hydrolase [Thermoactinospora rubra]
MTRIARAMAGVLMGAALALTPSPAHAARAQPAISWKACEGDGATECGTLRVPIDWAKPGGAAIELAVARRRAGDPGRRVGALVVNYGGGPGADFVQHQAAGYFSPEVLARFDIVGFDPRGVGRSNPVRCSADLVRREPWPPTPRDQADFDRRAAFYAELAADCRRRTGPVYEHLDTVSVVRDMEALRVALGERKLTYHGVSAGTLAGQQYAELFGDRIRAMSLDSSMDHSLDTRRFLLTAARSAEDSFGRFLRWCERDSGCALHGRDVARIWDGLLARADRGELRDPNRPDFAPTAFDLINEAHLGGLMRPDPRWLAERIAAYHSGKPGPRGVYRGGPPPDVNEVEMPAPALCQDWRLRIRDHRQYSRYAKAMRQVAPHMRTAPDIQTAALVCAVWPGEATNPQHRLRIRNTPKLLMINSLFDPATGYGWAANVHRQTRRASVLVTYEGAGHGAYERTPCTRAVVDRYLLDLRVPPEGTRCPAAPLGESR